MPEVENKNEDIKVLIITGNKIKGHNLQKSLGINEDLKLVGVAEKATETYYIIESLSPEIIVIDLDNFKIEGINIIAKIKQYYKDTKVIVLSSGKDCNEMLNLISLGINAYCLSEVSVSHLALIIKTVARGACCFDPLATSALMERIPNLKREAFIGSEGHLSAPLSEREKEVLKLMVKGKSNTLIAKELIVSVHTAKAHVCNILHKMNVEDRVQAAVKAVSYNLV